MQKFCDLGFRIALYFMPRQPFPAHISCRDMSSVTASHFCLACSVSV